MPPQPPPPDLRLRALPERSRRTALDLHERIRGLIIDGSLAPGSQLKQAVLARELAVSRIPMREAFRMLQQEGLIRAEPNQRAVVASYGVQEQANVWAARMMLETLAVQLSVDFFSDEQIESLHQILLAMRAGMKARDQRLYRESHRSFHAVAGFRAGEEISKEIVSLADKTTTFLSLSGKVVPHSAGQALADHQAVFAAIKEGDRRLAASAVALHIARPAIIHLKDVDSDFEPTTLMLSLELLGIAPE